jgi:hypothetical protein
MITTISKLNIQIGFDPIYYYYLFDKIIPMLFCMNHLPNLLGQTVFYIIFLSSNYNLFQFLDMVMFQTFILHH